jgi:hypothetical protein
MTRIAVWKGTLKGVRNSQLVKHTGHERFDHVLVDARERHNADTVEPDIGVPVKRVIVRILILLLFILVRVATTGLIIIGGRVSIVRGGGSRIVVRIGSTVITLHGIVTGINKKFLSYGT